MTYTANNHYLKHSRRAMNRFGQTREAGAAYLMLLLAIMVMGIGLAAISEVWHTTVRREKEQELLFIGDQYRQAIGLYYAQTPAGHTQRFPLSLEDLLKDPRVPGTKRYLRKIFTDPITGEKKWGMVRAPGGGIMGVYSMSTEQPIKKTNFRSVDSVFEGRSRYSEWVFMYRTVQLAIPSQKNGTQ